MNPNQLKKLAALMLRYSDPQVLQSLHYPDTYENRVNVRQFVLTFTKEQLELAELILREATTEDLIEKELRF
jgi:hypothetical protein